MPTTDNMNALLNGLSAWILSEIIPDITSFMDLANYLSRTTPCLVGFARFPSLLEFLEDL